MLFDVSFDIVEVALPKQVHHILEQHARADESPREGHEWADLAQDLRRGLAKPLDSWKLLHGRPLLLGILCCSIVTAIRHFILQHAGLRKRPPTVRWYAVDLDLAGWGDHFVAVI